VARRARAGLAGVSHRFRAEVRAVARNVVWKGASALLEKLSRLALVLVAAPVLGQVAFGRFQLATTVTAILALATDLGLGLWTTRALARDRAGTGPVIGTTLRLRARIALPYAAATALAALLVGPGETRAAVLLLGASALASAFVDHFAAILRGLERFDDEAWLNVARALLGASLGFGALWLGRDLVWLAGGVAAGTVASGAVGLRLLTRGRGGAIAGHYQREVARTAVAEAFPIWLAGLFSLLTFKGDVVLVHWLAGDAALGAYAAAFRLFEGSQLLPSILMAATFPALARARGDVAHRRRWERLAAAVLLVLGALVGLTFHLGSEAIVATLFGARFAAAAPSLAALGLATPLMYLNSGLTHFLIARDRGRLTMHFFGAALPLNIAANLIAIPRLGGPGAAWATVATEAILTACCLWGLSADQR